MHKSENPTRDYTAISPSAKSLVLLKGLTNIPFAREAAEVISYPDHYNPQFSNPDIAFWKRVVHFEIRYWSIDQLLSELEISNILELSSGFSFRGLDTVMKNKVHYIDTDLPDLIHQKQDIIATWQNNHEEMKGNLELKPLNALNPDEFKKVVASFPPGPIVIVNEGLMMYLNQSEKESLCSIIREILILRGGYWITGDIYRKSSLERISNQQTDSLKDLVDQQHIEDNMFDSFEAAKAFFETQGLMIDKEAMDDYSKISSLKYLVSNATEAQLKEMQSQPKIQTTWRLKAKTALD